MSFFIIVLVIVAVAVLLTPAHPNNPDQTATNKLKNNCKPHKWSWKDNKNGGEYLSCDRCNMVPGSDTYSPRSGDGEY